MEHGRFPYLGFARKKQKTDIDIVNQVMDFTQTTLYSNMSADTLSGGIRQQVFFAMNLAQNCDTIVLDEPTTYLDINRQHKFYEDICTLKQKGKTILLVIHDLSYAVRIADYLIVMDFTPFYTVFVICIIQLSYISLFYLPNNTKHYFVIF